MDRDEDLDYLSSAPLLVTPPSVKPEDEMDMPTLQKVQALLAAKIFGYQTTDLLTVDETHFTVKQQLAMNQSMKKDLLELKVQIDTAIENVKEKYNG